MAVACQLWQKSVLVPHLAIQQGTDTSIPTRSYSKIALPLPVFDITFCDFYTLYRYTVLDNLKRQDFLQEENNHACVYEKKVVKLNIIDI
jgi:hypothetical protein